MKINTRYTYDFTLRFLHWSMAFMFIAMLCVGWYMQSVQAPLKWQIYAVHKSLGVTLLVLVFFRLLWRIKHKPSHVSDSYLLNILSTIGVTLLYVCMLAMIISGYVMSDAGGYQIEWFGVVKIPFLFEPNKSLAGFSKNIHELFGIGFAALICVHIAAAFYHHFFRKDRVLKSMMGR